MNYAGLRSLFRHHRKQSHVPQANPHRFRYVLTFNYVLSLVLFFRVDLLPFLFRSARIAFPFYFSAFASAPSRMVSPQDVSGRRNVCSRGGGVLSVIVGFILIPGSSSGRGPAASLPAGASKSGSRISDGGLSTRITFGVRMRSKRKSTERVPTTSAATVSSTPTTCGAMRPSCEIGAGG
jgi:hypothetical protein